MSSTSLVRSLSTGSPYWRMVRLGHGRHPTGGPCSAHRRAASRPRAAQSVAGSTSTRRAPSRRPRGPGQQVAERRRASAARRRKRSSSERRDRRPLRPASADSALPRSAPRRRPGRAHPTPAPARRRAAARRRGASPPPRSAPRPGLPARRPVSTGCSGTRVWACMRAQGGPLPRPPTSRAARTKSARVSSVAESRGASRCRSMSRKATAAARRTRCSTASVPMSTGVAGSGGSSAGRPAARPPPPPRPRGAPPAPRAGGSRPARSVFMRSRPQAAHTTGRVSPQRGQRSTSSSRGRAAAAPQRAQRASSPQCRQASRRAPPVRL